MSLRGVFLGPLKLPFADEISLSHDDMSTYIFILFEGSLSASLNMNSFSEVSNLVDNLSRLDSSLHVDMMVVGLTSMTHGVNSFCGASFFPLWF